MIDDIRNNFLQKICDEVVSNVRNHFENTENRGFLSYIKTDGYANTMRKNIEEDFFKRRLTFDPTFMNQEGKNRIWKEILLEYGIREDKFDIFDSNIVYQFTTISKNNGPVQVMYECEEHNRIQEEMTEIVNQIKDLQ